MKSMVFIVLPLFGFLNLHVFSIVNLTTTLGINTYAAKRVIDIVSTAGTVYAVVGIVAAVVGGGGIGVAILASAKALAQKYGKAAAAAW
ncbi:uberolysin/carnocyclin family circular bacteriocin [Streptococcus danieliae]|uniref:Circular bacteriocin, circularin A/uberolysin family n=1 Tax=Streptococcus danieliae TaxID=747656 RepID=A0A7Z0M804_9STRE|nr:uberolysin/carnocyclin family circular bacteriocin [Streptococcus danieliae]NYS97436.1 circular bacteriocin, circularin A/uberolysin family [Streptococcus danieliae]